MASWILAASHVIGCANNSELQSITKPEMEEFIATYEGLPPSTEKWRHKQDMIHRVETLDRAGQLDGVPTEVIGVVADALMDHENIYLLELLSAFGRRAEPFVPTVLEIIERETPKGFSSGIQIGPLICVIVLPEITNAPPQEFEECRH